MNERTENRRVACDGGESPTDGSGDESGEGGEGDDEATKNILVRAPESTYDRLSETKNRNGFNWLGMLLHAHRNLLRAEHREKKLEEACCEECSDDGDGEC